MIWKSPHEINDALAMSAQSALQEMGEFELNMDNLNEFVHTIADQGILLFGERNLYQIALEDYQEYLKVVDDHLAPLVGFRWWH